jgi:hypothetical protein
VTRRGVVLGAAAAVGLGVAGVVGVGAARRLGATRDEAAAELPGDDLLTDAAIVTTRATTIAAPPAEVWPWLVQMGYQRGGWYSIDAFERLIGAGDFLTGGSADRIVPELQGLAVGDRVPMNDHLALVVAAMDAPHTLVLVLPSSPLAWVWTFVLREVGVGPATATRLVIRTRLGARTPWARPLLAPLEAGHGLMEAVQLVRLRHRVETTAV